MPSDVEKTPLTTGINKHKIARQLYNPLYQIIFLITITSHYITMQLSHTFSLLLVAAGLIATGQAAGVSAAPAGPGLKVRATYSELPDYWKGVSP
jgi:hypothetical protein